MTQPWDVMAADARALPEVTRDTARTGLQVGTRGILASARSNAGWSRRIPGSVRTRTYWGKDRDTISLTAGGSNAPHAGPYEHGGSPGTFRHPTFGHRDRVVTQVARPFLKPAVDAGEPPLTALMDQCLNASATRLGFH